MDEGCGVGDLCDLPEDEPPLPPPLEDEEKDILSLKDFLSHIPSDAVFWPTYAAFSNYSRRRRWSNNYFEPIYIPAGDGMYIVIMPPGQNPIVSRSEYSQQLGLDIGGFFGSRMDVVEGTLIFVPFDGPFGEAGLAAIDVIISGAGSYLTGQSYWNENSAPGLLPNTVTAGQDVLVSLSDFIIGLASPAVDFVTTGGSFAYDMNSYNNPTYVSLSFPLTNEGSWNGDGWIVIWP